MQSTSQFEAQLKAWNARKNLKNHEWESVFNAIDKLPPGTRSRVTISGHAVPDRTIQRARKRRRLDDGTGKIETHIFQNIEQVSIQVLGSDSAWSTVSVTCRADCQNVENHQDTPTQVANGENLVSQPLNHVTAVCGPVAMLDIPGNSDQGSLKIEPWASPSYQGTALLPQLNTFDTSEDQLYVDTLLVSQSPPGSPAWDLSTIEYSAGLPLSLRPGLSRMWLENLPSQRIVHSMSSKNARWINTTVRIWGQFLADINCPEESSRQIDRPNPVSILHTLNTWMQGIIFEDDGQDEAIISANELDETKIIGLVICSIMNGYSGLDEIPIDRIVKFLGRFPNMNLVLVQTLETSKSRAAQSLAENLFRAALIAGEAQVISRLLASGLLDPNEAVFANGYKYTPIGLASRHGNLDVIKTLINHNVDTSLGAIIYPWFNKK